MVSENVLVVTFSSLLRLLNYTLIIPVLCSQKWSPLTPRWSRRWELRVKKLKSMVNEYQSITGREGGHTWQQRVLPWSVASIWLIPHLAAPGNRGSHIALQTTVWRLNFSQSQSSKPSPSTHSFVWWCLPADCGHNATINRVAIVINHKPSLNQSSLCCLRR